MGAKSAIKLRKRAVAFKCSLCGRKLMSAKALIAHQRNAHNIINIVTARRGRPPQNRQPVELDKTLPKDVEETEVATPSKCAPELTGKTKREERVEFECPKCFKRFSTYFPAKKHIQKYHCVDTLNYVVSPRHPDLIEPVRLELCTKCMRKVKLTEPHECEPEVRRKMEDPLKQNDDQKLLLCAACEQWFPNCNLFNSHVVSLHTESVESMFFSNINEFTKWKTEMEQQTKASFSVLDKDDSSKQHYICSFRRSKPDRPNTSYICPATIVVQQFPNGFQVHFYQKHYKHSATAYKVPDKYKKYSITSFLKSSEDYNSLVDLKPDENDLYVQFKSLMEGIVVDAAKINIATLKVILGKALEITSILSNYDEELDDVPIRDPRKIMLEDRLAKMKAMDPVNKSTISGNTDTKRKNTHVETIISDIPEKRPRLDDNIGKTVNKVGPPLKIVNSFSLADTKSKNVKVTTENIAVNKNKVDKVSDEQKSDADKEKKLKVNGEPSSFADSYKDFVVKNFPNMESVASRTRSKPIKTRIGEFKPVDVKVDEKTKAAPVSTKVSVSTNTDVPKTDLLQKALEKTKSVPIPTKIVDNKEKAVSFSPKLVDDKANPVSFSTKVIEDKTKVLPRIDVQIETNFKESTNTRGKSQLTTKLVETQAKVVGRKNSRASFDKPKVDFDYEVKEQADDCNILILKI